jgi:hypothetical protein
VTRSIVFASLSVRTVSVSGDSTSALAGAAACSGVASSFGAATTSLPLRGGVPDGSAPPAATIDMVASDAAAARVLATAMAVSSAATTAPPWATRHAKHP